MSIVIIVLLLSIFYKSGEGIHGIVGAIVLLMIVGGYLFFLARVNTEVQMLMKQEGIQIGEKLLPYSIIKGFVLDMEKNTGKLKNIVFVLERSVAIYTLKDSDQNQKQFFSELSKIIPFLDSYHQGTIDKFMRKLKL